MISRNFKRNALRLLTGAALCFGAATQASAALITFDDLRGNTNRISNGYHGFTWRKIGSLDTSKPGYAGTGYANGAVSGDNVAFNRFGDNPRILRDEVFDFNSVSLTSAWRNNMRVTVKGLLDGEVKYNQRVRINTRGPSLFNFDFLGIDKLVFNVAGGRNAGLGGDGTHFAMDNFNYSVPVPEPGTLGLLAAGAIGVFATRRRRTATVTA